MADTDPFVNLKDWSSKKLLRDYQHASKTFRDGNYRLAPKQKFLFYVVFNFSPSAAQMVSDDIKRESSMMVKSMDLPSYTFDTQLMNQYNRWRAVQTKINYNAVQLRFHDDMSNISKRLWYFYLHWYYEDQKNGEVVRYTDIADTYSTQKDFNFGMANPKTESFFSSIQLYSIYGQKKFSEYTLINPIITQFTHDTHDHSQSEVLENSMQIQYETVKYATGKMGGGQPNALTNGPKGFGDLHYDHDWSPNDYVNNTSWEKMVNQEWKDHLEDLANIERQKEIQRKRDFSVHGDERKKYEYPRNIHDASESVQKAKSGNGHHSFPVTEVIEPGIIDETEYQRQRRYLSGTETASDIATTGTEITTIHENGSETKSTSTVATQNMGTTNNNTSTSSSTGNKNLGTSSTTEVIDGVETVTTQNSWFRANSKGISGSNEYVLARSKEIIALGVDAGDTKYEWGVNQIIELPDGRRFIADIPENRAHRYQSDYVNKAGE